METTANEMAEGVYRVSTAVDGPQHLRCPERLAGLKPARLALMHGSSFRGDGAGALRTLARHFA